MFAPNLHTTAIFHSLCSTAEEEEDDEWGVTAKPTEQLYMGDRKAAELMYVAVFRSSSILFYNESDSSLPHPSLPLQCGRLLGREPGHQGRT